jgi:hypothetical protein
VNSRDFASKVASLAAGLALAALWLNAPHASAADAPAKAAFGAGAASPLAPLAWISGSWAGTQGETTTEEHWTDPTGGLMLGMNRARRGDRVVMFEFLRIVARGDSIFYIALPRGRGETAFPMKELAGTRVVFENLAHDFPQRISYWQDKPGELHARTEGTMDGKVVSEEWVWRKTKLVK